MLNLRTSTYDANSYYNDPQESDMKLHFDRGGEFEDVLNSLNTIEVTSEEPEFA